MSFDYLNVNDIFSTCFQYQKNSKKPMVAGVIGVHTLVALKPVVEEHRKELRLVQEQRAEAIAILD